MLKKSPAKSNILPKIAVILPNYNPGPEFEVTLQSLREQTVPFTLFLVDDASPRKPDYAPFLKDFNHVLIELKQNVGVGLVRNAALERILAEGYDYVAPIDCGDVAKPERLRKLSEYLAAHPETGIVGSSVEMVFEGGRSFVLTLPANDADARRVMWYTMPVSHPAIMFRSDVFRKVGLYAKAYETSEDFDLVRRMSDAGMGVANLQEVLCVKHENRNSLSWKKRRLQLKGRLFILWRHRDLTNPHCIAGLLKTLVLLATPAKLTRAIKLRLRGA